MVDITNSNVVGRARKGRAFGPCPVAVGERLYMLNDILSILTCYEAKTGQRVYQQRVGGRGGYTASPVAADGRLYLASEEGEVRVVKAGPKYELLALNRMGDVCMATPAVSDGLLLVRTQGFLYGLGRAEARTQERP